MKPILKILTLLFLSSPLFAQWFWSNPSVQNNNINDVWMFSSTEALAVGEVGTVLNSTNGGVSWNVRHVVSGFYNEFRSVVFSSPADGIICGQNGLIIKSDDYGKNWNSVSSPTTNNLNKIFYVAPNKFWCAGDNGTILYSEGGTNFVIQNSGTLQNINSIFFTDSLKGYAVANSGILLRTTNGGNNWLKIALPTEKNINGIYFPSGNVGYTVADSGKIFKTLNGGISWSIIGWIDTVTVTFSDLKTLFFRDDNHGWIAGKEARIFYTANGGARPENWQYQNVSPYWRKILSIKFIDNNNGLAVGEWGTILRTTAGGMYWGVVNKGNDEILNRVWFANENLGWIVGDRGTILKTTNGGSVWFTVPVFNYWHEKMTADINSIQFLDKDNGFAVGDSSYFSYTTNGGDVWYFYHYDSLDRMKNLTGVYFMDKYNGVLVGGYYNSNPVFLRTTNRGQYWNILKPSDAGYKNVPVSVKMFSNYLDGYASCKEGLFRYTTDGGYTWRIQIPLPPYGNDYNDLFFVDDSVGWSIGKNGLLLKTTNRGMSWNKQETLTTKELLSIYFVNRNVGYIVGEIGLILKTTDGGDNWTPQMKMTNNTLTSVYMFNENVGWITGQYGTVLKTTNGGLTYVDISEFVPSVFNLKQNYPNPFNPTTQIDFSLLKSQFITLKVYNALGQEISTLIEGELLPGEHSVMFNSKANNSELPSGIYFFRLLSKDFQKTIKAVLLK